MMMYVHDELPPGWEWGAFWSAPGQSGYYAIHKDGKAVKVRLVPDPSFRLSVEELAELFDEEMPCK